MIKVTIPREFWVRGGNTESALRITQDMVDSCIREGKRTYAVGSMCVLGYASLACGAYKEDIDGLSSPCETHKILAGLTEKRNGGVADKTWCSDAMDINDSRMPDTEKEERLTEIGKENGFEFVFV